MTDDKAIEAALDAYRITPKVTCSVHETQVIRMRAALAAADKVRAEGEFDAQKEYDRWLDDGSIKDLMEHCFAAGLAKGDAERSILKTELELERVRLAACGVIANANTPETAAKAREMLSDYWSASAADVMKTVDREMALRAERAALVEALKNLADAVDEYWDNRFPNEDMWNKLQKPVDQARLALVRKGV